MKQGALDQWDTSAGVRVTERRILETDVPGDVVYFPESMVPHLRHPLVQALSDGRRETLRLLQLYQFLLSTTHMETRVVNVGAERIANGRCGVEMPVSMRVDAFKVYCDEGYHALYSLDLAEQVAATSGVPVPGWDFGGFIGHLAARGRELLPDEPVLAQLLQTVVFETLITAVLNEAPGDPRLHPTVRRVLRDHARDEGRHHRFFGDFFHELWAGLSQALRRRVAVALPDLITGCLAADVVPVRHALALAGLRAADAAEIIEGCYGAPANPDRASQIARGTLGVFRSAGVFDVPGAQDAFAVAGLSPAPMDQPGHLGHFENPEHLEQPC